MKKRGKSIIVYFLTVLSVVLLSVWGSSAVTVISENSPIERKSRIIIDPGHGGVDGGATSVTGKLESAFNLEIGLRLRDLLSFLGYQTKMIRTEDISVYTKGETIAQKKMSDLKERVRICNEPDGAILLSIHQNTFPDGRYSGAQIFYSDTEGSHELAKRLQTALGKRTEKQAKGIYLMEHITCPGVLIECGFLSNWEEEAKLRSPEYQKLLVSIIAVTAANFIA